MAKRASTKANLKAAKKLETRARNMERELVEHLERKVRLQAAKARVSELQQAFKKSVQEGYNALQYNREE